jgi:hypothetical protein
LPELRLGTYRSGYVQHNASFTVPGFAKGDGLWGFFQGKDAVDGGLDAAFLG